METGHLKSLIDYHYWAARRILEVLDGLTPEQFTRDLGSSFPSVQATLAHMLSAEAVWLNRCTGETLPRTEPADLPGAAAVRTRWQALEQSMRNLVETADPGRAIVARTKSGQESTHSVGEVLEQLVMHGTYHRGQLTTLFRQLGATPQQMDLILYYREQSGHLQEHGA